jgi:hypothetical protein
VDTVDIYFPLYTNKVVTLSSTSFSPITSFCGLTSWDEMKALSFTASSHTSTTIELKFTGTFNQFPSDESWGIRDFRLSLKMCDTTCKTCSGAASNNCVTCLTNAVLSSSTCTCRDYYYHKPYGSPPSPYSGSTSGSCTRCDMTCKTCSGATSSDCLTCDSPDSFSSGLCSKPSCKLKNIFFVRRIFFFFFFLLIYL